MHPAIATLLQQNQDLIQWIARFGGAVDPAPDDYGRRRALDYGRWGGISPVDPAPFDLRFGRWNDPRVPQGPQVDPVPLDLSRVRDLLDVDLVQFAGDWKLVGAEAVTLDHLRGIQVADVLSKLPGGGVTDPAPFDRTPRDYPQYRPKPIPVDPVPYDFARWHSYLKVDLVDAVAQIRGIDASKLTVKELAKVRIRDVVEGLRGPITDPAPDPFAGRASFDAGSIARMDLSELQGMQHKLRAEHTRVDSMLNLVSKRIGELEK